ncbi:GNAT family N-acetyltransferase [Rhodanobacter denitrificans]|uniref:Acetyltransferase, ribosomal protein N-acetylase n=1 Tax=Rhodanobacter denitrificans TaxID=666685 RepID=M4NL95_9GAMM|nr:GNAT family protein [Rhodanobacter denitrificans]AGG88491.1 acetyltransferase, ribosomal protein N-acetylase [Rhodanobacter denitrificans]UJJ58840.1 GNAT family N-acetyltransferase [Rhodanobacter denitrificans]UJM87627.1 GNAT family N-acetyltransferase [Rhodanobacter denitrificans]
MELVTARLRIDALRPADAEALFACRADPAVARYQGWCPADVAAARGFIVTQPLQPAHGWFQRAIRLRENGRLIGDLGLNLPEDARASVEFGISIAPAGQGRGYAGEAVRALFEQAFGAWGRHRVQASADPRNLACVALLRALGMRQEAHHRESLWLRGEWVDDVVFALLAREWLAPPP